MKENDEKLTLRQMRDIAIESGLQLIPYVGGSLATAYFGTKQEIRFKRLESFYRQVATQIEALQIELAKMNLHDEESLVAIIEELNEQVEREHTNEKRELLKNYLINTLKYPVKLENYDQRRFFLETLRAMSLLECKLLGWLYNQTQSYEIGEIAKQGVSQYAIVGAISRLRYYGFIIVNTTSITIGAPIDNMLSDSVRISDFGRSFCEFCMGFQISQ